MKPEFPLIVLVICFGLLLTVTRQFSQTTILPKSPPSTPVTISVQIPQSPQQDLAMPIGTPAPINPNDPRDPPLPSPPHVVATMIVPVPIATDEPAPEAIPAILAAAMQWLGVPYAWGGCSHRGVDCSCFYQNVMAAVHISVPRNTTMQIAAFTPIPRGSERLGDAVFFDNTCSDCGTNPTHVGLVIGGGRMIDAGDPVQVESYLSPRWASHNPRFGRPRGL